MKIKNFSDVDPGAVFWNAGVPYDADGDILVDLTNVALGDASAASLTLAGQLVSAELGPYDTIADLPAASSWTNWRARVRTPAAVFYSDGSTWTPEGKRVLLGQGTPGAASGSIVGVAATFINLTAADSAATPGKTQISSGDVHGLTSGVAAGKCVYVSWASGAAQPADGLRKVLSVDSTKIITLDLDSTGVANFGTPTVRVLNTKTTLVSVPVPAGLPVAGSRFYVYLLTEHTNGGGNKIITVEEPTAPTVFFSKTRTNATLSEGFSIWNVSPTAQACAGTLVLVDGINGGSASSSTATTIDFTSAKAITICGQPAAANEFIQVTAYYVEYIAP